MSTYHIIYSNGQTSTTRGPFQTLEEAKNVFEHAPVMPGEGAYLMDGDVELDYYYEEKEEGFKDLTLIESN